MTYYLPSSVVERDGNFMVDQRTFDSLTGHCVTKRTVIYKQSTKSFQHSVRFYNPTEIIKRTISKSTNCIWLKNND